MKRHDGHSSRLVSRLFFRLLPAPRMGLNGVYLANVLNGIICAIVPVGYAWAVRRRFPRTMDEVMLIPADFGVPAADRLDLSVLDMTGVVSVSRQVVSFCQEQGIDARRAYFAGLALEEMAGNAVLHGFTKDKKSHALDIRISRKGEDLILRVKDDCIPFNPADRLQLFDPKDPVKNMGIHMIYRMAKDVTHQNMLGLNVLTIRI